MVRIGRLSKLPMAALAGVLVLLAWPVTPVVPVNSLDQSWIFGVHSLVAHYWAGQPTLDWTYGPLGFLGLLTDYGRLTFSLGCLWTLICNTALALMLLRRLTSSWGSRLIGPAAIVTLVMLREQPFPAELYPLLALLILAELIDRRNAGHAVPSRWRGGLLFLAAVTPLIKFSTGISVCAVAALGVLALSRGRRALRLATVARAGAFVVASNFVLFSLLTLQPLRYLRYVTGSLSIAAGYGAMAVEGRAGNDTGDALLLGLVVVSCAVVITLDRRPGVGWLGGAAAIVIYLAMKEGFVRHDTPHLVTAVTAFLCLPLALGSRGRSGVAAIVATAATFGLVLGSSLGAATAATAFGSSLSILGHDLRDVVGHDDLGPALAAMREAAPLSPDVLTALDGHRVQVDPFLAALSRAYGFTWGPVDVWQAYQAYTPLLDARNAESLLAGDGPDRILRPDAFASIDDRDPLGDSPQYQLAVLCNFRPVVDDGGWQVLARTPNRCGERSVVSRSMLPAGVTLEVPAAPPGKVVLAALSIPVSVGERVTSAIYRPAFSYLALNGVDYRLVTATAAQPMVIGSSYGLYDDVNAPLTTTRTLAYSGPAAHVEVTVYEMSVSR